MVSLLKTHFSPQSYIVKSQENRIELVTRPVLPQAGGQLVRKLRCPPGPLHRQQDHRQIWKEVLQGHLLSGPAGETRSGVWGAPGTLLLVPPWSCQTQRFESPVLHVVHRHRRPSRFVFFFIFHTTFSFIKERRAEIMRDIYHRPSPSDFCIQILSSNCFFV